MGTALKWAPLRIPPPSSRVSMLPLALYCPPRVLFSVLPLALYCPKCLCITI